MVFYMVEMWHRMSTFTGEALPVPKSADESSGGSDSVLELNNIVLMVGLSAVHYKSHTHCAVQNII